MDRRRFDDLVRAAASSTSRRQLFKILAAGVAGGFLARGVRPGTAQEGCDPGLEDCGGVCVDLLTDAKHCGVCDNLCESGQCTGGTCIPVGCPSGTLDCGGVCVDPTTDPKQCGGCGIPCPSGLCTGGVCVEPEPTPAPTIEPKPEPTPLPEPTPEPIPVPTPDEPIVPELPAPGPGSEPGTTPASSGSCFRRITIWINAFVPREIPGITTPVLFGPYAGLTMVNGLPPGRCFLTDDRGFSHDPHALQVVRSQITIDVSAGRSANLWRVASEHYPRRPTYEIDCLTGEARCTGTPRGFVSSAGDRIRILRTDPGIIRFPLEAAIVLGCVADSDDGSSFTGVTTGAYSGVVEIAFDALGRSAEVSFDGLVDRFPAYEIYVSAETNDGRTSITTLLTAGAGRGYAELSTEPLPIQAGRIVSARATLRCPCGEEGQVIDLVTGACGCPPGQTASPISGCGCPEPLEYDRHTEQCVCPRDLDPDTGGCPCRGGQEFDPVAHQCVCRGRQEFDRTLGRCACRNRCPGDQLQDDLTCDCSCLGGQVPNRDSICECPPGRTCPAGSRLDGVLCFCLVEEADVNCTGAPGTVCTCPGDQVVDPVLHRCRCPQWYQVFDYAAGRCACHPNLVPGQRPGECICSGGRDLVHTAGGQPGCECPGGQSWNRDEGRCRCPGRQQLNALGHCACPTQLEPCEPPKVRNPLTCVCECPNRATTTCGAGAHFDDRICSCVCDQCPPNFTTRTDPGPVCRCVCEPDLVRCPSGQVANATTCQCEPRPSPPPTAPSCPAGERLCGDRCIPSDWTCCPGAFRDGCRRLGWSCCRSSTDSEVTALGGSEFCNPLGCSTGYTSCTSAVHACPVGSYCFGYSCCPNGITCSCDSGLCF